MCGLFGVLTPGEPIDLRRCVAATQMLSHRGPDGFGIAVGDLATGTLTHSSSHATSRFAALDTLPDLFLGHRRLAVIDLADDAAQPMTNEDGTVWTVFNGEIYNHRELRTELEEAGHTFVTDHSDTEVLVHGYEAWGSQLPTRLRGMFAFAILDLRTRRVTLCRDRFGEKPLYYRQSEAGLVFASELKAILTWGYDSGSKATISAPALAEYLGYGFVPAPRTILTGVSKLRASEQIIIQLDGIGLQESNTYWSLDQDTQLMRTPREWQEAFESELAKAIELRMQSDVPLGAFLSGGLDSSIVVRGMSRSAAPAVRTFSVGFREEEYDESQYAREVARRYETTHTMETLTSEDLLAVVDRVLTQFDEPFADSSAIPTYLISRVARQHVTVCLSGDGGDELLAGYTRYQIIARLARHLDWRRVPEPVLRLLRSSWPEWLRGKGLVNLLVSDAKERYLRLFLDDYLIRTANLTTQRDLGQALLACWPTDERCLIDKMCVTDSRFYVPEDLMVKVDRTSMLCSLEARSPLLDHRLFEVASQMPLDLRFDGCRGKLPFRRILLQDFSSSFVQRRKKGFSVPLGRWLKSQLRADLEETLCDPGALTSQFMRPAAIKRLLRQHLYGSRDQSTRLWRLYVLNKWHAAYSECIAATVH